MSQRYNNSNRRRLERFLLLFKDQYRTDHKDDEIYVHSFPFYRESSRSRPTVNDMDYYKIIFYYDYGNNIFDCFLRCFDNNIKYNFMIYKNLYTNKYDISLTHKTYNVLMSELNQLKEVENLNRRNNSIGGEKNVDRRPLDKRTVIELRALAVKRKIVGASTKNKSELIMLLRK